MIDNLLNMPNEELRDWFRAEIVEAKPDPEWERRLKEYHDNIERDFQEEWSKKHFKWFFTKRRQKKLRDKVTRRYAGPVFWLKEEMNRDAGSLPPRSYELDGYAINVVTCDENWGENIEWEKENKDGKSN